MGIKKYPLIKYVLAFIIGIISTSVFELPMEKIFIPMLLIIFVITQLILKNNFPDIRTIISLTIVLVLGNYYFSIREIKNSDYPFHKTRIVNSVLFGEVQEISLIHKDRLSFVLQSDSMMIKDSLINLKMKIKCNLSSKYKQRLYKIFNRLGIGNKIRLEGTMRKARGERNPGEFDYYKYLKSKGISGLFSVRNLESIDVIGTNEYPIRNFVFGVRKILNRKIEELHNKRTSALLKGLLLADRGDIDYKTKENFINSGVIHVLAVSGLHVGFIVVIFMFLFSRMPIYLRTALTIGGLLAFLVLTNMPSSVFRATIMVIVLFVVYLDNREYNSVNALSITALILLIINPSDIFNPGFQLSFSAVLSILIIYPILQNRIKVKNKIVRWLLLFFAVSFSAQIGTIPFTLIYFQKLSVISLLANLFVIPIIGVIVGLGVLTLVTASVSTVLALYFASANMLMTDILLSIVNYSGSLDFAFISIPNFSLIDGIVFYSFVAIAFYIIAKFTNRRAIVFAIFLVVLNLFFYLQLDDRELLAKEKFSVMLIDIGQGDGILLKFPNGETALIDAGNATQSFDNGERVIAPLLKRLSINKIDYGFITHVDGDHYRGFLYLLKHGFIKRIYKPRLDTTLKKDLYLESVIKKSKIPLQYYSKSIIDFDNLRFYILNDTTDNFYNNLDMNNRSGVFKIVFGSTSFLFTGDAEKKAEKMLTVNYKDFLNSNILKLGHHGSKSSSSELFLNFVSPQIGLVSAGENNKFGHPSPSVLERLKKRNIAVYRTDIEGALLFQSDGRNIKKIDWRKF